MAGAVLLARRLHAALALPCRHEPAALRARHAMLVQFLAGDADNFITNVHIGRSFNMDGAGRISAPTSRAGTARRSASGMATR